MRKERKCLSIKLFMRTNVSVRKHVKYQRESLCDEYRAGLVYTQEVEVVPDQVVAMI